MDIHILEVTQLSSILNYQTQLCDGHSIAQLEPYCCFSMFLSYAVITELIYISLVCGIAY